MKEQPEAKKTLDKYNLMILRALGVPGKAMVYICVYG